MKAYVVGVGNVNPRSRASRRAVKYISMLQGLLGVTLYYPRGTAIIFDTLNNAKIAKNLMEHKDIQTGREIGEVEIDEKYAKKNSAEVMSFMAFKTADAPGTKGGNKQKGGKE